ncbi:hypothetical protein [uncultured Megamonas sp.]|uniref:hypothetical protein n=1 Tax=uncultured Megamonas sp. TaxID=286140 RepID=UPI00259B64FB|nr:hypothetical protein [uncultured Megamonas sp.]
MKTKQWSKLAGVLFTTGTIGLTVSPVYADDIIGNNGLVEITDGQSYSEDNIYGWYKTDATNVTKGKVNISGGTIDCSSIYGGYSKNGISTNNEVNILGKTIANSSIYGGYSNSGNSENNEVNIFEGTFKLDPQLPYNNTICICGGYSNSGNSINNEVNISGGIIDDGTIDNKYLSIYGGYSNRGDSINNKVTISGGDISTNIYGGYSDNGNSTNNEVNISGGTIENSSIYGGYSNSENKNSGNSTDNVVSIYGGTFKNSSISGGYSKNGSSTNNIVNIYGGTFEIDQSLPIPNNRVHISGGYSASRNSANNNIVNIYGGEISSSICGGYSDMGNSTNNIINIYDGVISNSILGSFSDMGNSTNNIINIYGGVISNSIYGGFSNGGIKDGGNISKNLIRLSGNADVSKAELYGYGENASNHTGNTLVIDNWKNNSTQKVRNFDNITFKSIQWKNGGVVLNITDEDTDNKLKDTKINVDNFILSSNQNLNLNDSMTLIQSSANTGLKEKNIINKSILFTQGVATIGNLEMQLDDATNNLISKISSIERNPQTDIVLDSRVAGTAFVNQGADIATDSLNLLMNDNKYGVHTFGAVYGSQNKYDVNSDLKINGWNTIAGAGNIIRKDNADVAWGIFYENGTGNYRTNNSFNGDFFRSDGSLLYNGGGAAIRYKKDDGMYYEASLRAGTLNSSMSKAVKDGYGNFYGFDSDSNYWGAHLGIGKLLHKDEGEWDLYGKYFHTKLDGDKFDIAGDEFIFDDVTSDRLRLGVRYTTDTNNKWDMYYGLAWDYEFNGDSNMKAGQFEAAKESLQGSTGIIELGTILHSNDLPWQADINLKGYVGEKEGLLGMVNLTYLF